MAEQSVHEPEPASENSPAPQVVQVVSPCRENLFTSHGTQVGCHHSPRPVSRKPAAQTQFVRPSLKTTPGPTPEQMSAESADCVAVADGETVPLGDGELLVDLEPLGVAETERDEEGVALTDLDPEAVGLGERDLVPEGVPLPERVTVPLALPDLLAVGIGDEQGLALPLLEPVFVTVGEGDLVGDGEVVADVDSDLVPEPVRVSVGEPVAEKDALPEFVSDAVALGDLDGVGVPVAASVMS